MPRGFLRRLLALLTAEGEGDAADLAGVDRVGEEQVEEVPGRGKISPPLEPGRSRQPQPSKIRPSRIRLRKIRLCQIKLSQPSQSKDFRTRRSRPRKTASWP
jgi:hypothetical protein